MGLRGERWRRHINAFKAVVYNFRKFLEERGEINIANKSPLSAEYQCSGGSRSGLSCAIAERPGSIRQGPALRLSNPALSGVAPFPSARDKEESNERELSPLGCKTLSSDLTGLKGSPDASRSCTEACNGVFAAQFGQSHGSGWNRWSSYHNRLWLPRKALLRW